MEETCISCSSKVVRENSCLTENEKRICFECCRTLDIQMMDEEGEIDLFVRSKGVSVFLQNFSGNLSFIAEKYSTHEQKRQTKFSISFVDERGFKWIGVKTDFSDDLITCKRVQQSMH